MACTNHQVSAASQFVANHHVCRNDASRDGALSSI
jgi:hypothetical protein